MKSNLGNLVDFSGVSHIFPEQARTFKQVQVCINVNIPPSISGVRRVLRISCDVKILKTKIVSTPRSASHGGQILTGLMLAVEGRVGGNVEYISAASEQSVGKVSFEKLFSTYIILDERFTNDSDAAVTPYVEDIYLRMMDDRRLTGSVMLLLDAVTSSL